MGEQVPADAVRVEELVDAPLHDARGEDALGGRGGGRAREAHERRRHGGQRGDRRDDELGSGDADVAVRAAVSARLGAVHGGGDARGGRSSAVGAGGSCFFEDATPVLGDGVGGLLVQGVKLFDVAGVDPEILRTFEPRVSTLGAAFPRREGGAKPASATSPRSFGRRSSGPRRRARRRRRARGRRSSER